MKKKFVATLVTPVMICFLALIGCSKEISTTTPTGKTTEITKSDTSEKTQEDTNKDISKGTEGKEDSDQDAADKVAALIDAIYVQKRTDDTDKQCTEAKTAWDALTDTQKELVEGENADPDYFGKDTGDASKDDARNQDAIGENEILVVSFGTSFNGSRVEDIKGIEDAIQKANPDWSVRRAFTAQIIINHIQARDGEYIDNMEQALERAAANGVKNLVIQPTHLMHGAEYDELVEAVEQYKDKFNVVKIAEPLLGEVGKDATVINKDKEAVAKVLTKEAFKEANYKNLKAAKKDGTAVVFLGHGTFHTAKVSYSQMQSQMKLLRYDNVFIGTVEGDPEETSCKAVMEAVAQAGYKKVILRPFMVVAGDHANNDMAGQEEDSWLSILKASGNFESVETQIMGLGSIPAIQEIYIRHTEDAIDSINEDIEASSKKEVKTQKISLTDGVYLAEFTTDSSMFHVSEAYDGKGTLTVAGNEMTIHISLGSKNILNLYAGLAEDAKKEGAKLLLPTEDTVTYQDGITEEVYGFDVPVPALETEFDLALIGKKGVWYDHKVSVSNPVLLHGKKPKKETVALLDGTYEMEIDFEGGTGKAEILSPAIVTIKDKKAIATVQWNSPNYDYMIVEEEKFLPVNTEGDSVFEIPILSFDEPINIVGDTIAMSKPYEIEYKITFFSDTAVKKK